MKCPLNRTPNQSIRNAETSIAADSCAQTVNNPISGTNVFFLKFDHGAQQALLGEYVDLGSHGTYVILDSGCTPAMGSRFAIDRLLQACQRHPKHDQILFSMQPSSSKFSFANGEQPIVKERLAIHFRNDRSQNKMVG